MSKLRFACAFLLTFIFLISSGYCFAESEYIPGEIIVKFKPNVINIPGERLSALSKNVVISVSSIQNLNAKFGVIKIEDKSFKTSVEPGTKWIRGKWVDVPDFSNIHRLILPLDADVMKVVEEYNNDPNVEYAEPVYVRKLFTVTPNDPVYKNYIYNTSNQWNLFRILAGQAWDTTTGESSVIVAVIDTGANGNHEDLSGRTVAGYNYITDSVIPAGASSDDHGHGSHVSGIIAANTNNGKGIAGINWYCKIMPLKIFDSSGVGGDPLDSAAAIIRAADNGAKVINMSYGAYVLDTTERNAVNYAYNVKGCVLVGAAGNDGLEQKSYPASFDNVICVASSDKDDKRSVWTISDSSNYGSWVDVSAPGGGSWFDAGHRIYSLWQPSSNSYAQAVGTSQAAPLVSGLAALIFSQYPLFNNAEVVQKIKDTTDNIDYLNPGYEGKLGEGRINAFKALSELTAKVASLQNNSLIPQGLITIEGTATGEGFTTYEVSYIDKITYQENPSTTWEVIGGKNIPVYNDVLAIWNTGGLWGDKLLKVKVFSSEASGISIETTTVVEVGISDGVNLRTEVLNFPNPFNPHHGATKIYFKTTKKTESQIFIFDIRGNLIKRIHNGSDENYYSENGEYRVPWDGRSFGRIVANGVYIYQVVMNGKVIGRNKMIVMK